MKLLVSGATATVRKYADSPFLGRLTQPRCGNDIAEIASCGMPWGGDNNALQGVDPDGLLEMWDAIADSERTHLKFVTAPDAVMLTEHGPRGDWPATLWLWRRTARRLAACRGARLTRYSLAAQPSGR